MTNPINPVKRKWLIALRKDKKMTIREMADIFSISFQHYSDIEHGRRNPSIELSLELAKYFSFPVEKLLEDRTKFKRGETNE